MNTAMDIHAPSPADLAELRILNALPVAACVFDASARMVMANDQYHRLLPAGLLSRHIAAGESGSDLIDESDVEELAFRQFAADVREVIAGRRDSASGQFLCMDNDWPRRLDARALPVRGDLRGRVLVTFMDGLEPRSAGQSAQLPAADSDTIAARRLVHLQQQVDELEAFGRSVGHDLRNPLCAVDGFARMLLDSKSESLTNDGRESLEFIVRTTEQLSRMLDGLHSLAGLAEAVPSNEVVDISALARDSAAILQQCFPRRKVEMIVPDLPSVNSDARLLGLVMQHLLENAWKCTTRTPRASVEVGRNIRADGTVVYHVRDNGVGFSEQTAAQIFLPFRRLALAKDFAGDGVGLATAKRAIEKLNGRIWVESRSGQGATFYFTLG